MPDPTPELRSFLLPAGDLAESVSFYRDGLGLGVRMQDRDVYAELSAGPVKIALATPADHPVPGAALPVFRVPDVPAAVFRLVTGGAMVVSGPATGAHEIRAVLRDPAGNAFVLYQSLPQQRP